MAAVRECYARPDGPPDFDQIRQAVENTGQVDSLTSVLSKLTDLRLFASAAGGRTTGVAEFLRTPQIIDLHGLSELRELVVFIVLDTLRACFTRLPDQRVDTATALRELRCIIVVDEAHNFLPKDNAQVLEKCLRELRGKGIGVWLLTQNPRDLDQPRYNYGAEVNFHICLKLLDAKPSTLEHLYSVPASESRNWSARVATFSGEGIVRDPASPRGFSKVSLRQFWQRIRQQTVS